MEKASESAWSSLSADLLWLPLTLPSKGNVLQNNGDCQDQSAERIFFFFKENQRNYVRSKA